MKRLFQNIVLSAVVALSATSCSNRTEEINDYPKSQSYVDSAINKALSVISQLSLKEKLAQLQSGSIYVIKSASDSVGNLNFDTLRKYYPYGMG